MLPSSYTIAWDTTPRSRRSRRRSRLQRPLSPLQGEALERFRELAAAYPSIGVHGARQFDAEVLFAGLSPEEQSAAIRKARSYAETLQGRDRNVPDLDNWLRRIDFALALPPPIGQPSTGTSFAALLGLRETVAPARPHPVIAPPPKRLPPPEPPDRQAEALRMVEEGHWPRGGTVFVAADSPEGTAWEAHFARFGRPPLWMSLGPEGRGWRMPCRWPPKAPTESGAEA